MCGPPRAGGLSGPAAGKKKEVTKFGERDARLSDSFKFSRGGFARITEVARKTLSEDGLIRLTSTANKG